MLLVVEDRATFHLLPVTETPRRSTEQALRRMGWLDLAAAPGAAATNANPPSPAATAPEATALLRVPH